MQINHSIVLTDLRMPKLDGMQFFARSDRKRYPLPDRDHRPRQHHEAVEAIRLAATIFSRNR
jgi:hypothetical protein